MDSFDPTKISAADDLVGKTINGWFVKSKIQAADPNQGETGGNFSICYIVEKDSKQYFMKVLDYKKGLSKPIPAGKTRADVLGRFLLEFDYEKKLSSYCNTKKASKVILYIDSGEISLDDYFIPTVSYIVYEMANGNIRKFLDFSKKIDLASGLRSIADKLKSLHDVATGINSLHSIDISHQDIKPSNVMHFTNESKLGDLGRSLCFSQDIECPYALNFFWGDLNYAPPEALFRYQLSDLRANHYQADNYMLGGLIVFYLTGVSINALIEMHLPWNISMRELYAKGVSFERALPFLVDAFQLAITDIKGCVPFDSIRENLALIVEYLCCPDPTRRGHPTNLADSNRTASYDLYKTITELDLMYRRAKLELSKLV